jgi:N-acetylmuramoyl-L-alanine amidase
MKTVLISAGHNDQDPGAVSGQYKEATLAVKMRDRVAKSLRERGITTLEDGEDGVNDNLNKAIGLCKQAGIAVEIHFNAGPAAATGIEALAKAPLKKLSQDLCVAISDVTGIKLRGGDKGWKPDNSGQHHRLGFCEAGGVILEVCFISNPFDMSAYVAHKEAVAEAVADVLALHAGWVDAGSTA